MVYGVDIESYKAQREHCTTQIDKPYLHMIVRILCPNYWVSGHEIGLTGSVGIALSIQNLIQLVFTSILRDSLVLCKSVKRLPQRFRFVPVKVQIPWHSLLMFVPMLLKESVLKVVHIRVLHSRPKFLEMFFF